MKRCRMGKTYIELTGETDTYEKLQDFFEEWGLEKASESSLGDELFPRVITYKGNGIQFDVIWYKNLSTIRICGDKNWYGDFLEASFDSIIGSYLPDCDHNTFDFVYQGRRVLKLSLLCMGESE